MFHTEAFIPIAKRGRLINDSGGFGTDGADTYVA